MGETDYDRNPSGEVEAAAERVRQLKEMHRLRNIFKGYIAVQAAKGPEQSGVIPPEMQQAIETTAHELARQVHAFQALTGREQATDETIKETAEAYIAEFDVNVQLKILQDGQAEKIQEINLLHNQLRELNLKINEKETEIDAITRQQRAVMGSHSRLALDGAL